MYRISSNDMNLKKTIHTWPTILLSIAMLSGCLSTAEQAAIEVETTEIPDSVEEYISDDQQGVVEVIHPVEPVELDLPTEPVEVEEEQKFEENLWFHAAKQFEFEVPNNQRLNAQKNWYLRHPAYMQRVSKRAEPFLYYIVQELERREMPMEIALLPIVESAFDPFAYSHGSAAGMWQFISGTAKRFGLKQTWWYDGRRDAIASTHGALDYLTYLHKFFNGNWLHALAAYNSGEGRVRNAIRKNKRLGKPTDFWSLDLPRETRAYVPKLLALADILTNRESYEFNWPEMDNAPVIEVVDIGSQIDLAFAAELAGLSLRELSALNPGFSRWATDPDGPHQLVLPKHIATSFGEALAKVDDSERLNWKRHKIRSGDSLLKLAKQYHTTVDIIKRINNLSSNTIRQGDHLLVPIALKELDHYVFSDEQRLAKLQNRQRKGHQITHTVRSGDTLWDIARKYNTSTRQLAKWNGMAPKDMLHPGKKLVVWVDANSDKVDSVTRRVTYTVRRGDSLARIANRFNVKVSQLRKWNNLEGQKYLQPGQKLTVIVDVIEVAA
jgi:membrane-bound lytic murein transglycosylase D